MSKKTASASLSPASALARASDLLPCFWVLEDSLEQMADQAAAPLKVGEESFFPGNLLSSLVCTDVGLTASAIEAREAAELHLEALRADASRLRRDGIRYGLATAEGIADFLDLLLDKIEAAA